MMIRGKQPLCNPALKQRHWEKIFKLMNVSFAIDAFTLDDLLRNNILDCMLMRGGVEVDGTGLFGLLVLLLLPLLLVVCW